MSFSPPPVLEINPRHPLIAAMAAQARDGQDIAARAALLFDLARVQDGDLPKDPAGFARRIERALAGG
jgi:molecular chaperone HtpG